MKTEKIRAGRVSPGSFRFRIVFLFFITSAAMLLMLFFNNLYAIRVVRRQVFQTDSQMLTLYMSQVDRAFSDVENYWAGLQLSSDLATIETAEKETDFYTAQVRLTKEIENTIPSYGYTEDLFVYFSLQDAYLDAAKYDLDGTSRAELRRYVETFPQIYSSIQTSGKWMSVEIGGQYYLIRFFRVRGIYMGGCVRVSTLISRMKTEGFGQLDYLTFCRNDGAELGSSLPALTGTIQPSLGQQFCRAADTGTNYMTISAPSAKGDYSLVGLVRDTGVLEGLDDIRNLILALCACMAVLLAFLTVSVRRWLIRPLDDLSEAMRSLSAGNLDVRLGEKSSCEEFSLVNRNFNSMTGQIKNLKINVYEEKMQRQKLQLQYMKLQVNPHFYINCLNVIHNLSLMNRNDLVQQMTTCLGVHLRYTLEGNSLGPLRRELDYVQNYLRIQQLRFGDSLACSVETDPEALNVPVPPLVVQTFVENTVKYQVVPGELVRLFIRIRYRKQAEGNSILIEIWDTGDGFPPEILRGLNGDGPLVDERGEHFGIRNIEQRLELIYQGKASVSFANHPETGGAFITICVPDETEREEEINADRADR